MMRLGGHTVCGFSLGYEDTSLEAQVRAKLAEVEKLAWLEKHKTGIAIGAAIVIGSILFTVARR